MKQLNISFITDIFLTDLQNKRYDKYFETMDIIHPYLNVWKNYVWPYRK